jgi:hypothetical protein
LSLQRLGVTDRLGVDVVGSVVHEEIDVLGKAACAVGDHGEAADQQVTGAGLVQGPADADDVVGLRRSCAAIIILVIHASASSKEEKR